MKVDSQGFTERLPKSRFSVFVPVRTSDAFWQKFASMSPARWQTSPEITTRIYNNAAGFIFLPSPAARPTLSSANL